MSRSVRRRSPEVRESSEGRPHRCPWRNPGRRPHRLFHPGRAIGPPSLPPDRVPVVGVPAAGRHVPLEEVVPSEGDGLGGSHPRRGLLRDFGPFLLSAVAISALVVLEPSTPLAGKAYIPIVAGAWLALA